MAVENQNNLHKTLLPDSIFILVLLLNLTGLPYFLAPKFNVDIAIVSLVLLGLNCLYIAANHKVTRRIFRKKHIFYWFIFLLLWPLLATIYAPAINFRELGLQVYYFILMLGTVVFLLRNGFKSFHRIITVAFIITILGLISSMFMSNLFQIEGLTQQLNLLYQARAYGFFMQPNIAATSLNLLFVVLFAGLRKTRILTMFLYSFGLFVFICLTGSRGSFIAAAAIVALIFIHRSIRVKKPLKVLVSPRSIITLFLVLACFQAFIPLLLSFLTANLPKRVDNFDVIDRIKAISQMNLSERTTQGTSTVARRLQFLKYYSSEICRCPILGKGFGSITFLRAKGILSRSSHNQFLSIAFETGIPRLVFYLLLLFLIYKHPRRKHIERVLCTNSYAQLLAVIILTGMVSNMVLNSRVLYCVVGCFIAMLIYPETITDNPAYKENTEQYTDNLIIQDEK